MADRTRRRADDQDVCGKHALAQGRPIITLTFVGRHSWLDALIGKADDLARHVVPAESFQHLSVEDSSFPDSRMQLSAIAVSVMVSLTFSSKVQSRPLDRCLLAGRAMLTCWSRLSARSA